MRVAKNRPPLAIPSVTGSFFPSVALPSMPAMPALPSMSGVTKYLPFGATAGPAKAAEETSDKDPADDVDMSFEVRMT